MKKFINDDCRLKEYVKNGTLYSVRKVWEIRSYMLHVAENYPNQIKYQNTDWSCQACDGSVREDQDHLIVCPGYVDLVHNTDLDTGQ